MKNELAALRRAFNLAVRAGRLPQRPAFPIIETRNRRTGFFEESEFRAVLALESSTARMSRLGSSLLFGLPLLEIDELMERIDAVTLDDLTGLVAEFWQPADLSAAGIGPDEQAFGAAMSQAGLGSGRASHATP